MWIPSGLNPLNKNTPTQWLLAYSFTLLLGRWILNQSPMSLLLIGVVQADWIAPLVSVIRVHPKPLPLNTLHACRLVSAHHSHNEVWDGFTLMFHPRNIFGQSLESYAVRSLRRFLLHFPYPVCIVRGSDWNADVLSHEASGFPQQPQPFLIWKQPRDRRSQT